MKYHATLNLSKLFQFYLIDKQVLYIICVQKVDLYCYRPRPCIIPLTICKQF